MRRPLWRQQDAKANEKKSRRTEHASIADKVRERHEEALNEAPEKESIAKSQQIGAVTGQRITSERKKLKVGRTTL